MSEMSSTHCFLHTKNGVSIMELLGVEFVISHTFQCKGYICIAHTGNCIMYTLGPFFVEKISHVCYKSTSVITQA